MEKGNPSMDMLRIHGYPFTPLPPYPVSHPAPIALLSQYPATPLSRYPVSYPAPLSRYPVIPEDSLCESS
jgi:hypothetical protein